MHSSSHTGEGYDRTWTQGSIVTRTSLKQGKKPVKYFFGAFCLLTIKNNPEDNLGCAFLDRLSQKRR